MKIFKIKLIEEEDSSNIDIFCNLYNDDRLTFEFYTYIYNEPEEFDNNVIKLKTLKDILLLLKYDKVEVIDEYCKNEKLNEYILNILREKFLKSN